MSSNSTDLMNGFPVILKCPTITTNNSTPTVENSIKPEKGTTDEDVISVYNAKLSHAVTLPTNMDMMGCRSQARENGSRSSPQLAEIYANFTSVGYVNTIAIPKTPVATTESEK
ncbi:hypothetical protein Fcan01_11280 [Folsomia candida]|uniref:Uncharacterized protein n=1 Tax=Folsomia candida TaxID=158441 RepID=A0A226E990_FOLCA|nr:hypothetical protein Fcan01_11280 [Folsomia candida]